MFIKGTGTDKYCYINSDMIENIYLGEGNQDETTVLATVCGVPYVVFVGDTETCLAVLDDLAHDLSEGNAIDLMGEYSFLGMEENND